MDKAFSRRVLTLEQIKQNCGQPIWVGKGAKERCGVVNYRDNDGCRVRKEGYTVHFTYGWEWLEDVWGKYSADGIYGLVEIVEANGDKEPVAEQSEPEPTKSMTFGEMLSASFSGLLKGIGATQELPKPVVYIAGKITGDPNYKDKFAKAQEKLEAEGYIVLNPAVLPVGLEYEAYFPINYAMIDASDNVYFLRDWLHSDGARNEMKYAMDKDKGILAEE